MAKHKNVQVKSDLCEAFANAKSEVESLQEEMQEWLDKMEENEGLSATSKHDEVSDCVDSLTSVMDNFSEAECTVDEEWFVEKFKDVQIEYTEMVPYKGRGMPRWMRASNAVTALDAVRDKLDEAEKELKEDDPKKDEINTLIAAIDNVKSDLEGVDFPGMF